LHEGKGQGLMGLGGNFLGATPDIAHPQRHFDDVADNSRLDEAQPRHLITVSVVDFACLAALSATYSIRRTVRERRRYDGSRAHVSRVLKPASPELRSETAIVAGAPPRTQPSGNVVVSIGWIGRRFDRIRQHIEHVVPGFTVQSACSRTSGFYLPNAPREGQFKTPLDAHASPCIRSPARLFGGSYCSTTIRSHDQFNTTIYGENDRYRGFPGGGA